MPSQITITAKTGPAIQATALVLTGLTNINIDMERKVLTCLIGSNPVKEFDLSGVTLLTDTITGSNHVIVVS